MNRFAVVLVLLLSLLAAGPAATIADPEEADESALVEEALDECEADPICEEEVAEAEEEAEAEADATYPPECALRSAKAHAVLKKSKLKLTIGYTTSEPTKATIVVRYGATKLSSFQRHLRRSGVIRITRRLAGDGGDGHSRVRIELDPEGTGCPSRRLVLFPK